MTPEQLQQFNEMYQWFKDRQFQQISFPLDEASKNTINESGMPITSSGAGGSGLIQTISIPSTPAYINVPNAYVGTTKFTGSDGIEHEYPYIS